MSLTKLEASVVFDCGGDRLIGIHHGVEDQTPSTVVVNVVGGPQYRVGSHRQFVLTARFLASAGFPCLRFDYRGMGDSAGELRSFTSVSEDIDVVVAWCRQTYPDSKIVLMGLCDGASAAAIYGESTQVDGLILINPWVHRPDLAAKVQVWHYYRQRLLSWAFWRRLLTFQVNVGAAAQDIGSGVSAAAQAGEATDNEFVDRMFSGLTKQKCPVLTLLSGDDLTAMEFQQLCRQDRAWRKLVGSWKQVDFPQADHTFSDPTQFANHNQVITDWLSSLKLNEG